MRLGEDADILQRITVDQQQVSVGTRFDDSNFTWVGVARTGQCQQLARLRSGLA